MYYEYKNWLQLKGLPYWGIFAMYGGGGYVAELGNDYSSAESTLSKLRETSWIDRYTRAVFVEFNIRVIANLLWAIANSAAAGPGSPKHSARHNCLFARLQFPMHCQHTRGHCLDGQRLAQDGPSIHRVTFVFFPRVPVAGRCQHALGNCQDGLRPARAFRSIQPGISCLFTHF